MDAARDVPQAGGLFTPGRVDLTGKISRFDELFRLYWCKYEYKFIFINIKGGSNYGEKSSTGRGLKSVDAAGGGLLRLDRLQYTKWP